MLKITDLTVKRAERRIACPDLSLKAGETLALCGPSGVGKTSLLLAIAGILRPESGTVDVGGQSLWDLKEESRARLRGRSLGYVFASFHLIDALNVIDNLQLARTCAGLKADTERAHHLLDHLGLKDLKTRRVDRLSQGQQQRVALARALMNRPDVVLADEPTAALDNEAAHTMIALLSQAARDEGAALLIATHDPLVMAAMNRTLALSIEGIAA